jgi:hypothetical protein
MVNVVDEKHLVYMCIGRLLCNAKTMSTITQTIVKRRKNRGSSGSGPGVDSDSDGGDDFVPFVPKQSHELYNGYNVFLQADTMRWWAYTSPTNQAADFRLYNMVWGTYDDPDTMYLSTAGCDYRQVPRSLKHLSEFIEYTKHKGYELVATLIFEQFANKNGIQMQRRNIPADKFEVVSRFLSALMHILERHRYSFAPTTSCPVCMHPETAHMRSNADSERWACQRFRYGDVGFGGHHEAGGMFPETVWKLSENGKFWVEQNDKPAVERRRVSGSDFL